MAQVSRPYPDDWDQRRRRVYQRDGYTCCNCQRQGGPNGDVELHAHHIVPKSRGGTDAMSNLITACKPCHNALHSDHKLAPTIGVSAGSDGPGVIERLQAVGARRLVIHVMLLIMTAGVGNVLYYLYNQHAR